MTAIVGILNKKAAVVAADTALTVTRGNSTRSIYYNNTKIFKLSDKYPAAVMTFSNADFMGVPLGVLINMYKDQEGDKGFKDLQGYVDNFIQFLDKERNLHDPNCQRDYLRSEILTLYGKVKDYVTEQIQSEVDARPDYEYTDEESASIIRKYFAEGLEMVETYVKGNNKCSRFDRYDFQRFQNYSREEIDGLMECFREDDIPEDMRDDFEKVLYDYLCSEFFYNGSGLVFVGYGKEDLYPSLLPIYVSGIIDDHFRYSYAEEDNVYINNDNSSTISPFAQTDVMMTVMKGVSPMFYQKFDELHQSAIDQTKQKMVEAMRAAGISEKTIAKVQEVNTDDIIEKREEEVLDFIRKEYTDGLVDTVETFNIEDMANMAESLIEITNLQRHITSSEESVGGPVDVAVITRDRGFVWMKHHDWAPSGIDVDFRKSSRID